MIDRDAALELLREPGPEPHLVQHGLASDAVMRALASHFGEDEELWGLTGLLHDWDYPLTANDPARHGLETAESWKVCCLPSRFRPFAPITRNATAARWTGVLTWHCAAAKP